MQAAQLTSVLNRLPQGLDASLGPGTVGLSGGEHQRLALPRLLLRESAALVLDEATSAIELKRIGMLVRDESSAKSWAESTRSARGPLLESLSHLCRK
jgi:ABC-type transport system involved in Fe-S cluster assembly fused permease/ATPase subunit